MSTSKNINNDSRNSYDPGWNDPPLFSYDEHTAQLNSTKPKTLLNKRISFPMGSSNLPTNNCPPIDPTLPPQPCNAESLPPPPFLAICPAKIESPIQNPVEVDNYTSYDFNSEEALASVMTNFDMILKSSELKNKNEIERRLDIMKKTWSEGKFNQDIQRKLLQLSEAVKDRNTKSANDLQISLMVDYSSLCSLWMSGVRHLIQHGTEAEIPSDS